MSRRSAGHGILKSVTKHRELRFQAFGFLFGESSFGAIDPAFRRVQPTGDPGDGRGGR